MATMTAADGVVMVGTQAIGQITGYSIEYTSDTVEDTVIGDGARTYKATLKSYTASIDMMFDPAYASSYQDDFVVGTEVTLKIYPDGVSGTVFYSGSAIVTGRTISTSVCEMVTASFTAQGTGDLTEATI